MAILLAHRQRSVTNRLSKLLMARETTEIHESIEKIVGESSVRE
jgi:hypothetical protein